jgi:hypothetical protein
MMLKKNDQHIEAVLKNKKKWMQLLINPTRIIESILTTKKEDDVQRDPNCWNTIERFIAIRCFNGRVG